MVKYLNTPQIQPAHRTKASSKLDPFKEEIARLLDLDPQASAVVIRQRIGALGGMRGASRSCGIICTRWAVAQLRERPISASIGPGRADANPRGPFWHPGLRRAYAQTLCAAVTESFSRMLYVQFIHSQNQESLHQGLLAAFSFFGRCPKELVFDNMPTAVTETRWPLDPLQRSLPGVFDPTGTSPGCAAWGRPRKRAKWSGRSVIQKTSGRCGARPDR